MNYSLEDLYELRMVRAIFHTEFGKNEKLKECAGDILDILDKGEKNIIENIAEYRKIHTDQAAAIEKAKKNGTVYKEYTYNE